MDGRAAGGRDDFVDGSLALALTLPVIAGSSGGFDHAGLVAAVWRIPAFATGFAPIADFWYAHVCWRRAGEQVACGIVAAKGVASVLLTQIRCSFVVVSP